MNLLQRIGQFLKLLLVRALKLTGKAIKWSAVRLWRLAVRGSVFAWHRLRGESGTVVTTLDKDGKCISMNVYDSKGNHVKTGKPLELTTTYRKNFLGGVPDHRVMAYRLDNINPFAKRMNNPHDLKAPQLRYLSRIKPEADFSIREEHWKYKNGVLQGGLSPDQRVLFDMFAAQQDKLVDQSLLNVQLASHNAEGVLDIIRNSAIRQDPNDLNRKIAQCEEHAAELLEWMPHEQLAELADIIRESDTMLRTCPDAVDQLAAVPTDYLTKQQVFYFRCESMLYQGQEIAEKAGALVQRYDFNRTWANDGADQFSRADDMGKAKMIQEATKAKNYKAVEDMARILFLGMINQSNFRSRNMYGETVSALHQAFYNMSCDMGDACPVIMKYFYEVSVKRVMCGEMAEAADACMGNYLQTNDYATRKEELERCNARIDRIYSSPEILGLEFQKLDNLINMYRAGTIKGTDGQIRSDVADALAALVYNLKQAGVGQDVADRLNGMDILSSPAMQQSLSHFFFSNEEMQQFSGNAQGLQEVACQQAVNVVTTDTPRRDESLNQGNRVPSAIQDPAFEKRLELIHQKYGHMVKVDLADREILPFPSPYVEGMMLREPELLEDIIRQVGAESLAYRHGDLTADELSKCPCYEPYLSGNEGNMQLLADRMGEYWMERVVPGQEPLDMQVNRATLPVSGQQELQFSADIPLDKQMARTDEFIKKLDSIVAKYHPGATVEQYCTLACPSDKAQSLWESPANQQLFARLMDECVAMSMAYRNGEVTPEELIKSIPNAKQDVGYTKEYADKLCNRVMGIYDGRIKSSVQRIEVHEQSSRNGMHR